MSHKRHLLFFLYVPTPSLFQNCLESGERLILSECTFVINPHIMNAAATSEWNTTERRNPTTIISHLTFEDKFGILKLKDLCVDFGLVPAASSLSEYSRLPSRDPTRLTFPAAAPPGQNQSVRRRRLSRASSHVALCARSGVREARPTLCSRDGRRYIASLIPFRSVNTECLA